MSRHPRIGIVFDHIESAYHVELIESAVRAARRRSARVVLLPGGALTASGTPGRARGFLYDFMRSSSLDALLILGGTLSNYCGVDAFDHWVRGLPDVPKLVVGIQVPSVASVAVDNKRGVAALVDHLVEDHGRRHVAFIAGPDGSYESEIRKQAYLESVERHGLALGESYVVPGGLAREQGIDAVVHLLEDKRMTAATLDGIVAANDEVALGVLEELARRKIAVPRQVSVVGFDDSPIAHAADPPLTTVCQRVYEQGGVGMAHLIEAVNNAEALHGKTVRPDVVVRDSCGCRSPMKNDTQDMDPNSEGGDAVQAIERCAQGIARTLSRRSRGRVRGGQSWESRIVQTLLEDLRSGRWRLVREFEFLARRSGPTGFEVCHELLTDLRREAIACAPEDWPARTKMEDLFQETRLALANVALFVEGQQKAAQAVHLRLVTRAGLERAHGAGLPELAVALEEQLPLLGIRNFVISRGSEDVLEIVARGSTVRGSVRANTVTTAALGLDEALETQDAVVVLPLSAADHQAGLAALEWGQADPFIYEKLRDLLGMALGLPS